METSDAMAGVFDALPDAVRALWALWALEIG
jgi:hypothetical protein